MIRTVHLLFTQGKCETCGTEHSFASVCPGCGAAAESDPRVDQRRSIVAKAIGVLRDSDQAQGVPGGFEPEVFGRLKNWVDVFMKACDHAGHNEDVGQELANVVRELVQSKANVDASRQFRPFVWYWVMLARLHDQLFDLAKHGIEALSANDLAAAEIENVRMQSVFDTLAGSAEDCGARLERWEQIESASVGQPDPMATLMALAEASARNRSGRTIFERDQVGEEIFARVTGQQGCPVELAVGLQATALQVEMLVDEQRFWRCAALSYRRLTGRQSGGKGAFAKLAPLEPWKDDLKAVQIELFESGFELRQLLQVDRTRTQARSLIRFGHIVAERCAPALVSTLVAAYRDRSYEELRSRDIGDLLEQARQVGLDGLLDGIDRALRHADAHGSRLFEIVEDGVRFTAERREYDFLTFEGLFDRVLMGWESVLAIYVGTLCAATGEGATSELDPIGRLDVSKEERIRFSLLLAGWESVQVSVSPDSTAIVARVPDTRPRFSSVALLAPSLSGHESVTVQVKGAWGTSTLQGPARPLVDYAHRDIGLVDDLATLPVLAQWTRDGEPMATADQLRKVLAVVTLREVNRDISFQERRRVLSTIGANAEAVGDVELSALLREIKEQLLKISGGRGRGRWERLVDTLASMAALDVPSIEL